jgi:glutamine cyclotransferase
LLLAVGLIVGLTDVFSPRRPRPPLTNGSIQLPGRPLQAIAEGDVLWVLTDEPGCEVAVCAGDLVKVDIVQDRVVGKIPVRSPKGLDMGDGSIWVASFADDTVLRIDPATTDVEATIPLLLPFEASGGDRAFLPFDLDATDAAVWVSTGRAAVAHIDPETDRVVHVVVLPAHTGGLSVSIGPEHVWVDGDLNGAVRIDPTTDRVAGVIGIDDGTGQRLSASQLVVRDGSVWALGTWSRPIDGADGPGYEAGSGQALVRIDGATGTVASILDVPDIREGAAWLLEDQDLWLVQRDGAEMRRVETASDELGPTVSVPFGRPLAVDGTHVWSAVGETIRSWELPISANGAPSASS